MAQRLVRAKSKIREARIPYVVPEASDMPERLDAVLAAIYLIFNEGYAATRSDLAEEAIRLGRLVRVPVKEKLRPIEINLLTRAGVPLTPIGKRGDSDVGRAVTAATSVSADTR